METRSDFKPRCRYTLINEIESSFWEHINLKRVRHFTLEVSLMYNKYAIRRHILLNLQHPRAVVTEHNLGESFKRHFDMLESCPRAWANKTFWSVEELVVDLMELPERYSNFQGLDIAIQEVIPHLF